jgi:hypothetical protein
MRFSRVQAVHPIVTEKDQVFDEWNFCECIGIY